ncbi:MAG: hypothetical protein KAJ24_00865 [Candidatus Aenigmarchaeota archaeon]|nr:hypothetical protein [Candidatus Aenigmarchaeota archaeon]
MGEKTMNKNNLNNLVDIVAIVCGFIAYMYLNGFICYGFIDNMPMCAFVTYEGTIQADISDWIYDDNPSNFSLSEISKGLFVFVGIFLFVAGIIRFVMRYIFRSR